MNFPKITIPTFNKKKKEEEQKKDLVQTIEKAFSEFEKSNYERLVLSIEPISEEDSKFYKKEMKGDWNTAEEHKTNYYPVEMLDKNELAHIKKGKEYQTVSFVKKEIYGVVNRREAGIEINTRIKSNLLLPKLTSDSNLNYSNSTSTFGKEYIKEFVDQILNNEIDFKETLKNYESSVKNYNDVTMNLLEKNGVYDSLEKLNERNEASHEAVLKDVRKKINYK